MGMPRCCAPPCAVTLDDSEEATLRRRANSARAAQRDVLRARIVLAAAQDTPNAQTAVALGVHVDTVRKWRRRFSKHGMDGLRDRLRRVAPASSRRPPWPELRRWHASYRRSAKPR